MARKLLPLNPSEVREKWLEVIRPMIDLVRVKTGERWLPDDVFAEIQKGVAHLYVGDLPDGEREQSIIVFKKYHEYGEDVLRIWIACNLDRTAGIKDFADSVRDIARWAGCRRVVWDSPRIGYKHVMPDIKLKSYRFEMEV